MLIAGCIFGFVGQWIYAALVWIGAFGCSVASFVAYEGEKAIGMVRLIGDSGMSFYIKDFAVLPEYQGMGVGKKLLRQLQQYISEHIDKEWAVSLELISTKEAMNFYKACGFEERPCEWDGPGMLKMIRKQIE